MIQIICGETGKGKTKEMLKKANDMVKDAQGTIVYVDKNNRHMYEVNNQIRLIDISEYPVSNYDGFVGFLSGLLSGNHDIETIFFDCLLKISSCGRDQLVDLIDMMEDLGEDQNFVLSISLSKDQLPESIKDKVIIAC